MKPKFWDKCQIKDGGVLCEAIVTGYNDSIKEFEVDYIHPESGKTVRMSNIPFANFRPEKRFVRADMNGKSVFEGDKIEYQLRGGMYLNKGEVVYDDEMCAFVVHSDRDVKQYLPLLSECNVFSLIS